MAYEPMKFEVRGLSPGAFNIANAEYELWEGTAESPTEMITVGEVWGINVKWDNSGWLLNFLAPGMTWRVECLLEKFGPLEGPNLPIQSVAFQVGFPPVKSYATALSFPPPVVPEGSYKFVVRIRLFHGAAPFPMVARAEGPVIDFYPPSPPP